MIYYVCSNITFHAVCKIAVNVKCLQSFKDQTAQWMELLPETSLTSC